MNRIPLSRISLKEGIIVLFALFILIEGVAWSFTYDIHLMKVNHVGGLIPYMAILLRSFLLPETITVLLLTILMNWVRRWFAIKSIALTWLSIGRYELLFLPLLMVSFGLIIPFTQTIRYLLVSFPNYSFGNYWNVYIIGTYSWSIYFRYLFPILFIGYGTLNCSLLLDYLKHTSLPRLTKYSSLSHKCFYELLQSNDRIPMAVAKADTVVDRPMKRAIFSCVSGIFGKEFRLIPFQDFCNRYTDYTTGN